MAKLRIRMKNKVIAMALMIWSLSANASDAFDLSEICKASVATNYGRDLTTMDAKSLDKGNTIRVSYTRPQDGSKFSFLCRKENNHRISLLDESLTGARWYGSDLADNQTLFFTTNKSVLIIRLIGNGLIYRESFFTKQDF